ncbi:heterokaryon incompatibility protein-domain-containing protein [Neurospora crassa]|nr:heterokaryon incompatibility protein-domain-containing protein [Neurospora crassa]
MDPFTESTGPSSWRHSASTGTTGGNWAGDTQSSRAGPSVGFDERNPNLCKTCRKVDFNSVYRSHDYEIYRDGPLHKVDTHWRNCSCGQELISPTIRLRSPRFRGLLGKLASYAPACSFCAFLYQCQVRLNLIPTKRKPWYCIIKPYFSLDSIIRGSLWSRPPFYPPCVQDVGALQMLKVSKIRIRGAPRVCTIPQPILRVVDSGGKTLTRNERAGGGFLGRKLDPNKVDLNLIEEWLTLCRSTHSHCKDVDAGRIPGLLVIDCTTGYIVPIPLERSAADQVADYVTLSYLWGTAEATDGPVVQSINRDGGKGLALPTQIPLVIRDAIWVVKQLGYRYLWVDRYCIPQEDAAAKHVQILNMGRIYSNSILTIIAAAGDGPEYGLPGVSSRPRITQVGVQINNEISLVLYEPPKDHIVNSKWNTRGWTYQEGLLSKRRLVFTDLMVYFQCQEMHGDEVLSLPIPELGEDCDEIRPVSIGCLEVGMVLPKVADWDDPLTAWDRISEYGPRELGHDSDALNAISGVMEMYKLAAGDSMFKYFCGLPILPIHRSLEPAHWIWHSKSFFENWLSGIGPRPKLLRAQRAHNNLTFSLVYSLCWRHKWDNCSELPASFEEARRKMFGSWTTAGWRTRKSKPDDIDHFERCLRISVQYSGELLLNWEDDNPRILDLSRNGKIPLSLNITGMVMDVRMEWKRHQVSYGSKEWNKGWVLTSPFIFEKSLFGSPRWLFEEEVSGKGDCSKLLFLILGCCYPFKRIGSGQPRLSGMILRPVTRLTDGKARTFHEKLDIYRMTVKGDGRPGLASLTREMEVRLI